MLLQKGNPEKTVRAVSVFTLRFIVCYGFLLVLAQVKPFWIDEWRIIYNLKYKSPAELWGQLDLLQQFPRIYLEMIKAFAAPFDYSYFTLRLPSFLVGTLTIIFTWRLMNRIYPKGRSTKYLFVFIIISSHTFTSYFIQVKQYTMDILLSVVAVWQFLEILRIVDGEKMTRGRYVLLCLSFFAAPFFSYTYPIVVAPIFLVLFGQTPALMQRDKTIRAKAGVLFYNWFPLLLCAYGVVSMYVTDVSQVMNDNGMHQYWGYLMMNESNPIIIFKYFHRLFAEAGSGVVYEMLFGVLGILGFTYGVAVCIISAKQRQWTPHDHLMFYSVHVIMITMMLFIAGKLPIGEPRLNVFTLPAIAILIIAFLDDIGRVRLGRQIAIMLSVILFLGMTGHLFTSSIKKLTGKEYSKALDIYVNTENAIILAQQKKIPIFITPDIAFPDQKAHNYPFTNIPATAMFFPSQYSEGCAHINNKIPGDWVLKTFPAYKINENVPVYAVNTVSEAEQCMLQLPPSVGSVLIGDGISYHLVNR